jgi:hypothetical protein
LSYTHKAKLLKFETNQMRRLEMEQTTDRKIKSHMQEFVNFKPNHEINRTKPDITVYCPNGVHDTDNEHFLVFKAPKSDSLLAIWTQSSCEGNGDNKIVMSRSNDGVNWEKPRIIINHRYHKEKLLQSSWAVPIVNSMGRIYCIYLKEDIFSDLNRSTSGNMGCIYSDDDGCTWKDGGVINMPRDRYDNPDMNIPKNWIAWQLPIRDCMGRTFLGYTQWTSPKVSDYEHEGWYSRDSRCKFLRFDNIDESPEPEKLKITFLPDNEDGIEVSYPGRKDISVAQEPSIVLLPDGRLFCVMRTFTGYIWYTVSDDCGQTWRKPEPLRYKDGDRPIKQPIAPCPIYCLNNNKYLLLFHNNDGNLGIYKPKDALYNRRPAFISIGTYIKDAHQPIWFNGRTRILDTDGITVGPKGTSEVATYTSLTQWHGRTILWYPDRKYYLLGKYINDDILADTKVDSSLI